MAGKKSGAKKRVDAKALVAEFAKTLEQTGQISLGEGAALMKSLAWMELAGPGDEAHDEAQYICFDAMEASSSAKAIRLYRKALAIDADCVDAIAGLAELTAKTQEEEIEALERAVRAGERYFGAAFFAENEGDFWGLIETRPYMRARQRLAILLRAAGRVQEAIGHLEGMLKLNPDDNQGNRELLLSAYLRSGDLVGARRLLRQYKEECGAGFLWGRVLECVLGKKFEAAEKALVVARKGNGFIEGYLSGERELPTTSPDFYSLGGEDEAVIAMEELGPTWSLYPDAISWLKLALARSPGKKV